MLILLIIRLEICANMWCNFYRAKRHDQLAHVDIFNNGVSVRCCTDDLFK